MMEFYKNFIGDIYLIKQAFTEFPDKSEERNKIYLASIRIFSSLLFIKGVVSLRHTIVHLHETGDFFSVIWSLGEILLAHDIYKIANKISELTKKKIQTLHIQVTNDMIGINRITQLEALKSQPSKKIAETLAKNTFLQSFWISGHYFWATRVVWIFAPS